MVDHRLYLFLSDLCEFLSVGDRLQRQGLPKAVADILLRNGVEDKRFLENRDLMATLRDMLRQQGFQVGELVWSEERRLYELMVTASSEDAESADVKAGRKDSMAPVRIGRGLIYSNEYQQLLMLGKKILPFDQPPFEVSTGETQQEMVVFSDKNSLLNHMIEEGKKGLLVQRYKGLGEMNPDQLWDTTMNPDKRNMMRVKIEDAVDADEIFTILMGDEVEPRREFIQSNALDVSMLDI